jgi:NADH dehydrogenase [ubiquinone] 1 alpha subcomplex assembly factor 7
VTLVKGGDLAARFRRLIRNDGPITVARFMGESNAHYYASRDPLGAAGDFVTAPEISQMFGELAGLWLGDLWSRAGRPDGAFYAELGPGRGTLARDALRAMGRVGLAPSVHLVEGSPALRAVQAGVLPGSVLHSDSASLPAAGPILLLANEFLDALPIRQLVRTQTGWRERMVGLTGEDFAFVAGPSDVTAALASSHTDAPPGTIVETSPASAAIIGEVAGRIMRQGGAALFIDYGHLTPRTGSTLQAVRAHRRVDPLAQPGEADLTAHVDFSALAAIVERTGCRINMTTQGEWLSALGIDVRAAALARAAPAQADSVAAARDRLVKPEEMGQLFKVMAITAPGWPVPAGFSPE